MRCLSLDAVNQRDRPKASFETFPEASVHFQRPSVHFKGVLGAFQGGAPHEHVSAPLSNVDWALWPTTSLETRPKGTRDLSEAPRYISKRRSVHFIGALCTF
jgi:hypothetical protein